MNLWVDVYESCGGKMKGILKDANIFVAARYDLKRLQECIIKESNDINLRDDDGDTPLIHCAMVGKLDCLEYLLQNGADPNIQNLVRLYFYFVIFLSDWKNSFDGISR